MAALTSCRPRRLRSCRSAAWTCTSRTGRCCRLPRPGGRIGCCWRPSSSCRWGKWTASTPPSTASSPQRPPSSSSTRKVSDNRPTALPTLPGDWQRRAPARWSQGRRRGAAPPAHLRGRPPSPLPPSLRPRAAAMRCATAKASMRGRSATTACEASRRTTHRLSLRCPAPARLRRRGGRQGVRGGLRRLRRVGAGLLLPRQRQLHRRAAHQEGTGGRLPLVRRTAALSGGGRDGVAGGGT